MQNRFDYVLNAFKIRYDIDNLFAEISYGEDESGKIVIPDHGNSFFTKEKEYPIGDIVWIKWLDRKIPLLFPTNSDVKVPYIKDGDNIHLTFDIISAVFYLLSGWQEYVSPKRDSHGRFPYEESIQKKLEINHLPLVDYYFDILRSGLEEVTKKKIVRKLWRDSDFIYSVTYDIDKAESGWKEGGYRELRKGRFWSPFYLIFRKLIGKDVWCNFKDILKFEREKNYKGTWFFLPSKKKSYNHKNADYNLKTRKYQKIIKDLLDVEADVELHASYGASKDINLLEEDKASITVDGVGTRFHFLNYDACLTPAILDKANILFDSSLYFPEKPGFRNSTCFPFYLYDLKNNRSTEVLEIPLIIMDTSFRKKEYYSVDKSKIIEETGELVGEIKKFHGIITILWHNTSFSKYKFTGWRSLFKEILLIVSADGAKNLTLREVYNTIKQD